MFDILVFLVAKNEFKTRPNSINCNITPTGVDELESGHINLQYETPI
jgi:hypothetical protein